MNDYTPGHLAKVATLIRKFDQTILDLEENGVSTVVVLKRWDNYGARAGRMDKRIEAHALCKTPCSACVFGSSFPGGTGCDIGRLEATRAELASILRTPTATRRQLASAFRARRRELLAAADSRGIEVC